MYLMNNTARSPFGDLEFIVELGKIRRGTVGCDADLDNNVSLTSVSHAPHDRKAPVFNRLSFLRLLLRWNLPNFRSTLSPRTGLPRVRTILLACTGDAL